MCTSFGLKKTNFSEFREIHAYKFCSKIERKVRGDLFTNSVTSKQDNFQRFVLRAIISNKGVSPSAPTDVRLIFYFSRCQCGFHVCILQRDWNKGELLFALSYDPQMGTLRVILIKARDLKYPMDVAVDTGSRALYCTVETRYNEPLGTVGERSR